MMNANAVAVATKENPASAFNANGVESNTANTLTLAELEWAMQLPLKHCNHCGQDRPHSSMVMAGLCQTCADELDEDYDDWYATREDALSILHW